MFDRLVSRLRGRDAAEVFSLFIKNIHHLSGSGSPRRRAARRADLAFDRRWGTETSRGVSVHDLGIARSRVAHCNRYDPSSEAMLRAPLAALALDPGSCGFVDYGAGKGRVMMLALQMGFAEVTGVELSARLCEVARANLDRFAQQNATLPRATLVGADATMFVPRGREIVAYFYNPFDADIMSGVRARLEATLGNGTERVHIIYANPEHADVFAHAPGWHPGPPTPGVATFVAEAAAFRRRLAA